MHIRSVETTPNPNSMKLNFDEHFAGTFTFTAENIHKDNASQCPDCVIKLLQIQGIKSVFTCSDFLTLNKDPRADWKEVLSQVAGVFGDETTTTESEKEQQAQRQAAEKEGQAHVFVQTFKGIPIQVKVSDSTGESRVSLGERFNDAALFVQAQSGADFLKERYWADHGIRYGERQEVANEIAEELRGKFDDSRLDRAKEQVLNPSTPVVVSIETIRTWLDDADWHRRLAAIEELTLQDEAIPLLIGAVKDPSPQVRRLATAALGATGSANAVSALCEVLLNDTSPGVRRTAGDALSDIGDPLAEASMCTALSDTNKLVRWRAARFLFDVGSSYAIPFLANAASDSEFEVRLEVGAAMQRIKDGGTGLGPAWKRIVEQLD